MSYRHAIESNQPVIDFRSFGDYQGTWYAIIPEKRVIVGWYGSCSECDALEGEIGYNAGYDNNGNYSEDKYNAAIKEFGKRYVGDDEDLNKVVSDLKKEQESGWVDSERAEVISWLEGYL